MNIRDIARIAGVSTSTVSKIVNGKDSSISEETRKKVLTSRQGISLQAICLRLTAHA